MGVFLNGGITAEIHHTIQARFDHQLSTETFNILCPHLVLSITSVNMAHLTIHSIDSTFPECFLHGEK
jgi:hypothetical protein